eukprot:4548575-Amphidinium_carterae.1
MAHSDPNAYGVAAKQSSEGRRFAVRYTSLEHYKAAATKWQLVEQTELGRFKATGVPQDMSTLGMFHMLEHKMGWKLHEVLNVSDGTATWMAVEMGKTEAKLVQ